MSHQIDQIEIAVSDLTREQIFELLSGIDKYITPNRVTCVNALRQELELGR
jgi:hypothetical protein|tara:strand:- start:1654 stop:1806 length:153 start_codon:yes stop_codon:yes gene_type:complete